MLATLTKRRRRAEKEGKAIAASVISKYKDYIKDRLKNECGKNDDFLENANAALNISLKLIKLLSAKRQISDGEQERVKNLVDEFDMQIRKKNWIEFLPKEECLIKIENYFNEFVASNTK